MKHVIVGSISVLMMSIAIAPAALASTPKATPTDLINLAKNGYFQDQGIPNNYGLADAVTAGRVDAVDIVKAAIEENRTAPEVINDKAYMNVLESQLNNFKNDYTNNDAMWTSY